MTPSVNLLPQAYLRTRRHRQGFRLGVAIGIGLLLVELGIGLMLHVRTGRARELLAEAAEAEATAAALKPKLLAPVERAAALEQQVALASELRATHYWSRLLGLLAEAAPPRVVLSTVSTEPPKCPVPRALPVRRSTGVTSEEEPEPPPLPSVTAVVVTGYAVGHDDLSTFVVALQASDAFASIDLRNARRADFMSRDAIAFELHCRW